MGGCAAIQIGQGYRGGWLQREFHRLLWPSSWQKLPWEQSIWDPLLVAWTTVVGGGGQVKIQK